MVEDKKFNQAYIRNLIVANSEESTYLEFKGAEALNLTDKAKNDIAKDVSAFANADGGILIYGVKEQDHKAGSEDFIDGNKFSKEWLEQIIQSRIKKPIEELKIYPIRYKTVSQTIYVIDIPRSSDAPHQASNKKFYTRRNFLVEEMEEYEIRNAYDRPRKTQLEILEPKITGRPKHTHDPNRFTQYEVYLQFLLKNVGKVMESTYKLEIYLPTGLSSSFAHAQEFFKHKNRHDERGYNIYSFPNTSEIYPDEIVRVTDVNLELTIDSIKRIENLPLICRLYYSSGTITKELLLIPELTHTTAKGIHPLSVNCFLTNS